MKDTYALLKEPVLNHTDINIPVKIIKIVWTTNEAFVQGTEEKTFCVQASNLIIEDNAS